MSVAAKSVAAKPDAAKPGRAKSVAAEPGAAKRVRTHREKMRAAGPKPITIWVPDKHSAAFQQQVAREIAIINASASEKAILEDLPTVDLEGWK